jgi:hypothetical protein
MFLHVAGLAAAEEALRVWLERHPRALVDPRGLAAIVVSAYLEGIAVWQAECVEFGCHEPGDAP